MSDDARSAFDRQRENERRRRAYARQAGSYDTSMGWCERWVLGGDHRAWACSQAVGNTVEVAIGTGLNLPHYPPQVRLTGVDLSPEMLERASSRAARLERAVDLREGDAQQLPFEDATFDSVVCTYALCSIHDDARAIAEMERVLVPGGRLILLDHVGSSVRILFGLQRVHELITCRLTGERQTGRPALHVIARGFEMLAHERLRAGIVERLVAIKTAQP